MTSISSLPAAAAASAGTVQARTAGRRAEASPAYVVDFSPLAYRSPSPYDSAGGSIVHLGARPDLLAEIDLARRLQKAALETELQAKEDARTGKTLKPFTLKDFLEKIDERLDLYAARRRERRSPESLTLDERAILREDRLGPLWKKRFRWPS